LSNVIDIKLSRLVRVHAFVALQSDVLSEGVHLTTNSSEELVVGNLTRSIAIEDIVHLTALAVIHANSEVVHGLDELRFVESTRSVVISNLELPTDRSNTSGSSLGKTFFQVIEEILLSSILSNGCLDRFGFGSSTKESTSSRL
jgi:hypothetical protein